MAWRMAKSLDALLAQINARFPNRDKSSDGGIGNAEHSARTSDHNPDTDGIVKARDFTHDPAHGLDSESLAEALVASKDERIKYIISNRKICSGTGQKEQAWKWRPYPVPPNKNPHSHHVHVSVKRDKQYCDDASQWSFDLKAAPVSANPIKSRPVLRIGAKGEGVKELQRLLSLIADGDFGPITKSAVKAFQAGHGLHDDGIVGPYTWDEITKKGT